MLRILIVDDHAVVREGVKKILADLPDEVVTGEACNGREALDAVRSTSWDAIVLDLSLPDRSGIDVLHEIMLQSPTAAVLILSMHAEDQYARRVLQMGALGYVMKDSLPEQLLVAIGRVAIAQTSSRGVG